MVDRSCMELELQLFEASIVPRIVKTSLVTIRTQDAFMKEELVQKEGEK